MAGGSKNGTSESISNPEPIITQSSSIPENNVFPINGHKLNGNNNFIQWLQSVMIFVCGKGKEDYLTRAAVALEESNPTYKNWKVENNMVMSWLLNSMTNEMGENFMYYKTA